jgi:2-polyprenyl-3-methyl-5-hydroxy-6-metoxy-1,4-benzoquinol methylase
MQAHIAAHCQGWDPSNYDFRNYLRLSSFRYYRAYRAIVSHDARRLCDVGAFWGVGAMTFKYLGFEVTMTESLRFYGGAFRALFDEISKSGINIIDLDPFEQDVPLPKPLDAVTVMAVIEHYPHSLKVFLENMTRMLVRSGILYVEVPNIAYWPKRIALLRGTTPLVDARGIYRSSVPFVGHHHEYSMAELRGVAELAGLEVLNEDFYNYSLGEAGWKRALMKPFEALAFRLAPDTRECLAITCRRREGQLSRAGDELP